MIITPHKGLNGMEVSCQAANEVMEEVLEDKAELNILCKSVNEEKTNNYSFFLFLSDPPSVTIEEENLTVSTGEELIIECEIDANPQNLTLVQW